jgi:predicted PurR-regulated permease PerM
VQGPDLPPGSAGAMPLGGGTTPGPAEPTGRAHVPQLLRDTAAWTWRLLLLALGAYALVWLFGKLYLLVLPFLAATFIAALLRPVVLFFRRRGFPRALATWATVLIGFVVLGALLFFVVDRVSSESNTIVHSVTRLVHHARNLAIRDLHVSPSRVNGLQTNILDYLNKHQTSVLQGVLSGVVVVGKVLTGAVLGFFICFFLLYDGDRIWDWLVGLFPGRQRSRIHEAGEEAWDRLAGWVRGTFLIALFHAVVVAITLTALGAPLVVPLAVLVFLGSFIPIVGAVVFGGFAALVTLVELGLVQALILVAVLLVDNQVEAHLLQPFLVGRYVRLHPLAVVLVIAGGGFLQGIEGAIFALPLTSAAYAAVESLHHTAARTQLDVPTPEPP